MSNERTPLLRFSTHRLPPFLWRAGATLVLTGTIAGSFGAHALKARADIPEHKKDAFETASRYAIYNGLGLLLVSMHPRFSYHRFAGPAIFAGSLVFSGSIFALVLGGDKAKFLGLTTPMGGLALMAGYFSLLF